MSTISQEKDNPKYLLAERGAALRAAGKAVMAEARGRLNDHPLEECECHGCRPCRETPRDCPCFEAGLQAGTEAQREPMR